MITPTPPATFHYQSATSSGDNTVDSAQALSRSRRNIGEPAKYWPQNSTIKIAIYDYDMDDEYVLAVKKAASEWLPHINLKFEFVTGEEGDIRITQNVSDEKGGGSAVGTEALDMPPFSPTMSLPRDHKHHRFNHVVMHEFGHMLGAHHAHQHPDAHIPWDMDKVYEDYKRTAGMDRQDVQKNVLALRSSQYEYLPYDGDSVMHYEISPRLTHGNWGQSESWSLSDGDIAWAQKAYPKSTSAIS